MFSKYRNINWKCWNISPPSFVFTFDNEKQPDQLPRISTRRRRIFHVEIRCFPTTFPSLADSPICRKSFATRSRASIVSQGAIRTTATAGWATCPPQSRQYRPSLSITSGERQNVRRKATRPTPWEERLGSPVKGEHTQDRIPFNFHTAFRNRLNPESWILRNPMTGVNPSRN